MRRSIGRFVTTAVVVGLSGCDESTTVDEPSEDHPFATAEANVGSWAWIDLDSMTCRDGSSTGFGVRLQSDAPGVMVFLQGGGGCYDSLSCAENAASPVAGASFGASRFTDWVTALGTKGVFNTLSVENPMAEWHHVYVPYCSGDFHAGARVDAAVDGVAGLQQFRGYANLSDVVDLVASYVDDVQDVALVGTSAGGFGVLFSYPVVADAFAPRIVHALVDAAPMISDPAIDLSCFEDDLRDVFDLRLPDPCPGCDDPPSGGFTNLFAALSAAYPLARFGLGSADADAAGVILLDRESRACGGGGVSIVSYRLGLLRLRDAVMIPAGGWSTYFWAGLDHTFTQNDALYLSTSHDGHTPATWWAEVLDGGILHVDP